MAVTTRMVNVRVPAELHRQFMKKCKAIDTDGSKNIRAYMREFVRPEKK
jgi:hypothetical protein